MSAHTRADLRTVRRHQSREAVVEVAMDLALERGASAVTVDEIAEHGGISRRTFFNYFPCKEEAFVQPVPELDEDAVAAFVADTTSPWTDALLALLQRQAVALTRAQDQAARCRQLVTANPELIAVLLKQFEAFDQQLAEVIAERARRLNQEVDSPVAAALCSTVLRLAAERWAESDDNASGLSTRLSDALAALRALLT